MVQRVFSAAVAAAVLAMSANAPALAQGKQPTAEKSQPSAAQTAARERRKKCGAEWKEAKAAGKLEQGTKWPQYWSACNKRLKGAGT
jgi:hypothetical protein